MIGFSINNSGKSDSGAIKEISINGEMTIQHAVEIKEHILQELADTGELRLDLKGVSNVDLIGLQLICAAHIASIKMGKQFFAAVAANEHFNKIVHDAGFLRHMGCAVDISRSCVWTGSENR
jgi:anti-anti-sigma factor